MSPQGYDPAAYKAGQQKQWDSVSKGWEKWWEPIERDAQHVSDMLLERAGVQAGHRVLDVATGIGEPAVTAARRTGPSGHVLATDQAADMLAIARRRAEAEGLAHLTFKQVDGELLELDAGSFDAALCRFGLMFMPDIGATLGRIHAALTAGGGFATAVWGAPEKVPFASLTMGVVQKLLSPPPPPPEAPNLFKLAAPGVMEGALQAAGFADVTTEPVTVTFRFASAEKFTEWVGDIAAPVIALVAPQPEAKQQEVWEAITEAARAFAAADGTVSLDNTSIVVSGRKG